MLDLKSFDFILKTKVKSGAGIINQLPNIINDYGYNNIGIVIDGNVYDNFSKIRKIIDVCEKTFDSLIIHIYRQPFEPTYEYLDKVKYEFKNNEKSLVECIVGLGGGSVIDTAKGIATLITNHENALKYRGFPTGLNPSIPVIAIPSTAGTGTELAFNAVFIDEKSKTKLGINTPNNYPVLAILDPEIVASAPFNIAIASGIGALVRSLETYVTPKANYISKIFSKEAFRILVNTLPKLVDNINDIDLWSKMQWGAYFSMAALSNSSHGPAGPFCYYLASNYNVPQGIGYGLSGLIIAQVNHKLGYHGYAELLDNLDYSNSKSLATKKEKSNYVINMIKEVYEKTNFPLDLVSYKISQSDIGAFDQFLKGPGKNSLRLNPVTIKSGEITSIIREIIG